MGRERISSEAPCHVWSSTVDIGGGTPARDFNNNFGTFPWAAASPFGYNGRYLYARMEMLLRP